jgi:hypothetical protein
MAKRPKKAWGDGSVFEYPEGSGMMVGATQKRGRLQTPQEARQK